MSSNSNSKSPFSSTIENIFLQNQKVNQPKLNKISDEKKVSKRDLELALTVILVDLASADQNFDMQEYNTICSALNRLFGTNPIETKNLINQATLVIKNLRGTSKYAALLKEYLSVEERQKIMSVVDEVICADGVEDGFETYLRHKFAEILQIELKPLNLAKR